MKPRSEWGLDTLSVTKNACINCLGLQKHIHHLMKGEAGQNDEVLILETELKFHRSMKILCEDLNLLKEGEYV